MALANCRASMTFQACLFGMHVSGKNRTKENPWHPPSSLDVVFFYNALVRRLFFIGCLCQPCIR